MPKIATHDFGSLFSVFVSVFVSLAVPRLLGDEIRIPCTDVNKKVKKYFHPIKQFFFTPTASPRNRMNARSAGDRCAFRASTPQF